jgi:Clr5 domain
MAPKRSSRQAERQYMVEGGSGVDLDPHRELIARLYHIEKMSLKKVMRIMSEEYNINVSYVSLR